MGRRKQNHEDEPVFDPIFFEDEVEPEEEDRPHTDEDEEEDDGLLDELEIGTDGHISTRRRRRRRDEDEDCEPDIVLGFDDVE